MSKKNFIYSSRNKGMIELKHKCLNAYVTDTLTLIGFYDDIYIIKTNNVYEIKQTSFTSSFKTKKIKTLKKFLKRYHDLETQYYYKGRFDI